MADADTIIHIKTTSDNSGAKETEKALDGVRNAAKRSAEGISKPARESMNLRRSLGDLAGVVSGKVKGAFTSLTGVVNTAAKAIGGVTKALGVVGFAIQGVQLVIDAYKALKEWLNRSKKEAEELAKTLQDARIKASIDAAIASYIRLNGQIAETLRMEGERVKIANQLKANNRALEDAWIDNAEQTELNALDRNDPDYDARAALVSEKYRRKRADLKTSRDLADISERQDRLYADADTKTQQANAFDKEVEKTGERVIELKRQIHAERDPERAKTLDQELDKLIAEQQKKTEAAKKLRQDASSMTYEALSLEGAKSAVILNGRTEGLRSDAAVADANRKIALGQQQRAAAEAQKKAAEDARKAAEQDRAQKLASERASLISQRDQLAAQMSEAQRSRELAAGRLAGAWTSYEADSGSTPAEMQRRYQAAQRAESAAEKALRQADSTIEKTARQMELVAEKLSRVDEALGRQSTHNDEG